MPNQKSENNPIEIIRHSLAHILAMAVKELWPNVKFGIGPAIENGFYYDFDFNETRVSDDVLPKIEKKMREIIKKDVVFGKRNVSKTEALKLFKGQNYKLELLRSKMGGDGRSGNPGNAISIYQSAGFSDLCKGPHIKSTKELNANSFKLTRIAGAYWLGDEKNKMLTRIYGIAFETEKQLKEHLKQIEEAEKRDHRKLGQKLGIYSIDDEIGPGLILWHPNGALLRELIRQYWVEEHLKNGYQLVESPHIGRLKLWQTSGHTGFYKENMFGPIKVEKDLYQLKPMNCPFAVKIYNSQLRSYRDLPLRWAEWAQVYRYEKSGVLHGLTRARGFTQDDAHIICAKKQFEAELAAVVSFIKKMLGDFGFTDYNIYLSVRDPKDKKKFIGDDQIWDFAEKTLEKVLKASKLKYTTDVGEAKFYGPAIDIKIKDTLGREWQCSTLQLDMNLPERFKMKYVDEKGKEQTPIMLHRTLLGGVCRFIAVLLEHYAGALPLWLSPTQVWIIPVGSEHRKYAENIAKQLKSSNIRAEAKTEAETVSKKIRNGITQKIPYLLVVGGKEVKAKTIAARSRIKDLGTMKIDKFIEKLQKEIKAKK